MKENISDHITWVEATKSQDAVRLGIDNTPNEQQLINMKLVANKCFEPLRSWYDKPIGISSFFRSSEINRRVGGSKTSQHCCGEISGKEEAAIDIDADMFNNGLTNKQIFFWLKESVEFDQLIWEFGDDNNPAWVHISYRNGGNRKQVLKAIKELGETKYIPF